MIETAPHPRSRTPVAVEALGYLGGTLAVVAGLVAVERLWPGAPISAELALTGVAAVALGAGGALTPAGRDPAFGRLRSMLWLLSAIAATAFTAGLCDVVLHLPGYPAATATGAVATCYTAVLWRAARTAPQHLALFGATLLLAGSGIAWAAGEDRYWAPGLAIWALSLLWAVAVERGILGPPRAGQVAAGFGLLLGCQLMMGTTAGRVLAIVTVLALLAAGAVTRRGWPLAFGVIGVIQVVPQTVLGYLPRSAAGPLAMLAAGLVLLATAAYVARRHRRHGPG